MAHIGLFCPPISGHLNPMAALGRALRRRGHRVTAFQIPQMQARIEAEQLEFQPLGTSSTANDELAQAKAELGRRSGLSALRFTLDCGRRLTSIVCQYGPEAVHSTSVDLLIVDDNEPGGGTVAEYLGLPFVNLGLIPLHREATVPPPFVPWKYRPGWPFQLRNQLAYAVFERLIAPVQNVLNQYRAKWNLPLVRSPQQTLSPLAQLSQLSEKFDFPRRNKPACLHYLGGMSDAERPNVAFPFGRLTGKPLLYASFGTLQNQKSEYYSAIASACSRIDAQLVISTGGSSVENLSLPSSVITVPYAPQLELLMRASLCITHGGLNTVMECLRYGVPMVVIPITNDQPAVAARVQWTGSGEVVPLARLNTGDLQQAVERVWTKPTYRQAADNLRADLLTSGGVTRGADIIEEVLRSASVRKYLSASAIA